MNFTSGDLKTLKNLIIVLKKQGVSRFKTPEFELELGTPPPKATRKRRSQAADTSDDIETDQYSPTDVLLWSAPGLNSEAS
mgnify:CR=1 FL=1